MKRNSIAINAALLSFKLLVMLMLVQCQSLKIFSPKVRIFVQFYEPWIVYIDADIDSCQPGADVTSPNSCRDVCIKLSTCDHSACGEFYFCAKNLKIVIKSSSKSVALCINCIDNWVKMHGHVQYSIGLVYMCTQNSKWSYCNIYVRS